MPLKSSHFLNVVVRYWCAHLPWSVSEAVVVLAAARRSQPPLSVHLGPRWGQATRSAVDVFHDSVSPELNHFL